MINPNQPAFGAGYTGVNMVSAPKFFTDASNVLKGWAAGATAFNTNLQPLATSAAGADLLINAGNYGLTTTQIGQIQGLLGAAGLTPAQIGGITIANAVNTLGAAAPSFTANATKMAANAAATADQDIDVSQTGSGITPIIGVNLSLMEEKLNIGIKYEHSTVIKLKNATLKDTPGMFPDGQENHSDLPAYLSVGASFKATDKMEISFGYHQYFDKSMKYFSNDKTNDEYIDNNAMEIALGLQYGLTDNFKLSAGYLFAQTSKKAMYQTDMSNSLPSHSFGFGGQYLLTEKLDLNLGVLYTSYVEVTNDSDTAVTMKYKETYGKSNILFAIGFGYRLTK